MLFHLHRPQDSSNKPLLPVHYVIPDKMPSRIRGREICWLALCSAGLVSVGYTAKSILGQNVTSPLTSLSLEERISKIPPDANTIHCPYWTSFSAPFSGPNDDSYTVHCENGVFSFIIKSDTLHNPNISYGPCVTQDADFAEMDISCVNNLLLQSNADDGITYTDDLDDVALLSRSGCTDDEWHQAPCSEIYPDNPEYALRGSANQKNEEA